MPRRMRTAGWTRLLRHLGAAAGRRRPGTSRRSAAAARFVALAGSVAVLTAGCGNPAGIDGNLTNAWAALPAPSGFTPQAGTCHLASFVEVGTRESYEQIECDLRHRTETVHVGSYPRPASDAATPPAQGSAGAQAAYRECDTRTTAYVGAPWRTGRLWIGVVHPSPAAWKGGARWFRCEVLELSSVEDDGAPVQRVDSLRNALKSASSPLRLACYTIAFDAEGAIGSMPATGCDARHNAEFVGVWQAGALPYPKQPEQWKKFHDGCRKLIASYVGVPADADLEFRTGVVSLPGGEDVWAAGDRGVRCYLWLEGAKLTSSLKGRGAKALPIQYE